MSGVREWDRSPFGDGTTPPPSSAPSSAPPAPESHTERLTVGPASVVIAPATDPDVVAELVGLIAAIPALHRVTVDAVQDGEARLTVIPRHPVVLTAEIRRVLGTRVRSCVPAAPGGRVVVDARPPAPPPPPPPDPADAPAAFGDHGTAEHEPTGDEGATAEELDGEDGDESAGPDGEGDGGAPGDGSHRTEDREPEEGAAPRGGGTPGPDAGTAPGADDRDSATRDDPAGPGTADPGTEGGGSRWTGRGAKRERSGRGGGRGRGRWGAGRSSSDAAEPDEAPPTGHAGGPKVPAADPDAVVAALTAAVDDTPGLSVLVFDRQLRIRAVAGVTPDGGDVSVLLGRPVVHAFLPVARRAVAAALSAALEGGERTVALADEDGVEGRLEVTCRPVAPGVPGGVCIVRDLEEGGTGTLLTEATRAFEITFRHSPIGQGLLSRSGHWLRVNGALAELLGRPAEELTGAEAVDAMHPDDRDAERERVRGLAEGDADHYVVGTRFVHVDGHVVRTHTRMTRISDEHGTTRGFVAQVVDAAAWARFRAG